LAPGAGLPPLLPLGGVAPEGEAAEGAVPEDGDELPEDGALPVSVRGDADVPDEDDPLLACRPSLAIVSASSRPVSWMPSVFWNFFMASRVLGPAMPSTSPS
jgi:hypothetical protein